MMTQDAIDRAARRLMRLRNPHRDLAQAMHRLVERRIDDPLANIPVVTTEEVIELASLPIREPDWIDQAMARSIRLFENPLNTPARRRLAGAALRRNCSA